MTNRIIYASRYKVKTKTKLHRIINRIMMNYRWAFLWLTNRIMDMDSKLPKVKTKSIDLAAETLIKSIICMVMVLQKRMLNIPKTVIRINFRCLTKTTAV